MTSLRNQFWQYLAEVVILCSIYIGAAKLANGIIDWNELVLPILPLAGITQAAFFLRGWRILPGVLLGEFFAILSAEVSWSVACGMALGCTLQGLCGAGLARRWGVCFSLGGSRDVFGFIVCMVMLSTLISPTIGITNLYLGGQVDRGSFAAMWWSCWAGNAIGVLVVTALLLVWCYPATHPSWRDWSRSKKQIIWAAVWLISLCTVSWLVFGSPTAQGMLLPFGETYHVVSVHYPLEYLPFLFVVWGALQFGQRGAVVGMAIASGMAVGGLAFGNGLFIAKANNLSEAILLLQGFVGIVGVSALLLGAAVTERASAQANYRHIFENAVEGIFKSTLEGRYSSVNPALARIYGYQSPEELIASLTDISQQVYVNSQRYTELVQQLHEEDRVLGFESQIYCKDGKVIWISQNVQVVRDASGALVGYEGTVQDITARKQAQEALALEHQELENQVKERTAALRESNQQLRREIVDYRRIEKALRESERRFRQLAENVHEIFWIRSLDRPEILYISPAYEKVWGRTCESLYQQPLSWLDAIHPLDRDHTFTAFRKQTQADYDEEYRIVRPDGSIRWIRDRVFPVHDEQGRLYRLAGIAEDITTRKQAETELQLQARQRQLFAEITLKIRQSLQLEAILQTTVAEVRYILQADRVVVYQLKSDGSGSIVTEAVVPEWFSILGQNINDPCFVEAYIHQYREGRIRAIDDLQQADVQTCYVEMLEQFGVRANLVVPIIQRETLWGLLIAHQCTSPRQWKSFEIELLRQLADQVGIALAQSWLLEHETETTQQLAQQNLHLEQAKGEAEAANRAKTEFLANMSHELRTPLNGILGYTQVLKREPYLSARQQQGLEIIQQCGEHLLTLLNDILDLSKIEAQKMELCLSDFQFPQFLQSIIEIVRIRAEQKHIFFKYQKLSQLPSCVRGDERRLRQILINLLGNAVKFTDTGGVTFKVGYVSEGSGEGGVPSGDKGQWGIWNGQGGQGGQRGQGGQGEVVFTNSSQENSSPASPAPLAKIRFIVEDTGIGIAPDQLADIFLPFHQSGDHHRQVEGTGLGLAISQRLVQMMDTSLRVESVLGQGSTFWLDLDLPEISVCPGTTKIKKCAIVAYQGHKRTVLIADDKWENRSFLVNLLSPLGFDTLEAIDGLDCLNQSLKIQPDLILLNLVMPSMDGLEVARQIRRSLINDIVVIATSASVFDYNQQECLAAGCNGFIPQPIRTENLFEQLKVHLGLEWIYEEPSGQSLSLSSLSLNSSSAENFFLAPPESEIATLYELAMMGDIKGISKQAKKIEQLDERFVPFAQQLCQLAEGFQEKQILEFVKRYVAQKK